MKKFCIDGIRPHEYIVEFTKNGSKRHTVESLLELLREQEEHIEAGVNAIGLLNEETSVKAAIINQFQDISSPNESDIDSLQIKLDEAIDSVKCRDLKILRYEGEVIRLTQDRDSYRDYCNELLKESKQ